MLRIELDEQPNTTTLHVEGKLAGDCVDELRRVWTNVRSEAPEKQAVVELSSVLAIDNAGRKLLCQMHLWGTKLIGTGLMIHSLIEEITGTCQS
jgi:ABC-type transporter Mla MlaB component